MMPCRSIGKTFLGSKIASGYPRINISSPTVMFSAFNLKQAHVIEGKVIHVSADSFIDEATGAPYYEAKIEVTPEGRGYLNEYGFILVAGMPAQVMIQLGDRTALSYLVKPFTEMLSRSLNEE